MDVRLFVPKTDPTVWGPFTISNVLTIVQILIIILSALVAVLALRANVRTTRGNIQSTLISEGRKIRISLNEALREADAEEKQAIIMEYRMIAISYFASAFELSRSVRLGRIIETELSRDLKLAMEDPHFKVLWFRHRDRFSEFVQTKFLEAS